MIPHRLVPAVLLAAFCNIASADPLAARGPETPMQQDEHRIDKVRIVGLKRTEPFVVMRELTFDEGETVTTPEIEESMQRIRNTQLFATVEHAIDGTTLTITVDERWTFIPIAKYSSGGGDTQLIVGAYDINVFGRYVEIGGQYERLDDTNSGVLWYRNPRFLDQRLEVFLNVWKVTRKQLLYAQWGETKLLEGSFRQSRDKLGLSVEKEWLWWLKTAIHLEYNDDKFSNQTVEDDPEIVKHTDFTEEPPPASKVFIGGPGLKLGRLDYDSFLIDGLLVDAKLFYADAREHETFTSFTTELKWFRTLPWRSTLGLKLGLGTTDTDLIQYNFFLGGLDKVRGFEASRFYGPNFYQTNLEYRIPSYDSRWFVLQHVFFYDTTGLATEFDGLGAPVAASVGTGIRLISPKIYRLVVRLDYAMPVVKDDNAPLSFGVQQFF